MAHPQRKPRLALFDLDHTLLDGDSDVLWCDYLVGRGLLERGSFTALNEQMEAQYRAGTVSAQAFAGFYVSTLEGRTPQEWDALRREFLASEIVPRIPAAASELVERHRDDDDLMVLTTATNRYITELTAQHLHIEHLLATEVEIREGVFTGRTQGILNMREGKVERLEAWLAGRGQGLEDFRSCAYSDSMNDLPLLECVDEPVAVDPDPRLAAIALARGWPILRLARRDALER